MSNQEIVSLVKDRTDIVDIIGYRTNLKKSGNNFIGVCPFHKEKTPSFVVSPSSQNYHCYGCGAHGDVINFLQQTENLSFPEALENLAEKAGILLHTKKKFVTNDKEDIKLKKIKQCLERAKEFYNDSLLSKERKGLDFLIKRGFGKQAVKDFNLGFASFLNRDLIDFLSQQGFDEETITSCGLIKERSREKGDFFKGRIIFPIIDEKQTTVGFAGRTLGDGLPKYLNSPESEIYHKHKLLYGINIAKDAWLAKKRAIVVEGYFDVIRLHQHAFKEAVATCGTALSSEQMKIFKKHHLREVYFLFDNDKAGVKAALKACVLSLNMGVHSKIVSIPEKDPDELLQKDPRFDLEKLLADGIASENFYCDYYLKQFKNSDTEARLVIVDQLLEVYPPSVDVKKHAIWTSKVSDMFGIEKKLLTKKFVLPNIRNRIDDKLIFLNNTTNYLLKFKKLEKDFYAEITAVKSIVKFPESLPLFKKHVKLENFRNLNLKNLFFKLTQATNPAGKILLEDFDSLSVEDKNLLAYIEQNLNDLKIKKFNQAELECIIFDLLSTNLRSTLDDKLALTKNVDLQMQLVIEYKNEMKKFQPLDHRKSKHRREQKSKLYEN